jgi:hypothetical protein
MPTEIFSLFCLILDKYGRFKQMRVNRRGLDRDMDEYMNKSSKYNREKLDQDMEYYMSKSKGYLDKSIDEYMTNAKKETR